MGGVAVGGASPAAVGFGLLFRMLNKQKVDARVRGGGLRPLALLLRFWYQSRKAIVIGRKCDEERADIVWSATIPDRL